MTQTLYFVLCLAHWLKTTSTHASHAVRYLYISKHLCLCYRTIFSRNQQQQLLEPRPVADAAQVRVCSQLGRCDAAARPQLPQQRPRVLLAAAQSQGARAVEADLTALREAPQLIQGDRIGGSRS